MKSDKFVRFLNGLARGCPVTAEIYHCYTFQIVPPQSVGASGLGYFLYKENPKYLLSSIFVVI